MLGKISIILSVLCLASSLQFPSDWKRCPVSESTGNGNNECLRKACQIAIQKLATSPNEQLSMEIIDPFVLHKMTIGEKNSKSPVKMTFDLDNILLSGMKSFQVVAVRANLSTPDNWNILIEGDVSKIHMESDYTVDGSILVLPIVGNGRSNLTFDKVHAKFSLSGNGQIKDGQKYLKITNQNIDIAMKQMKINLTNLFNGNRLLEESMIRVLNENWKLLYEVFKPSIEPELAYRIAKYSKKALEKIPYYDLVIVKD